MRSNRYSCCCRRPMEPKVIPDAPTSPIAGLAGSSDSAARMVGILNFTSSSPSENLVVHPSSHGRSVGVVRGRPLREMPRLPHGDVHHAIAQCIHHVVKIVIVTVNLRRMRVRLQGFE